MKSTPRKKDGNLYFPDYPEFRPNLTPREIFELGSFGGTYWRPIKSSVTGKSYHDQHLEFPKSWWDGIDSSMLVSPKCDPSRNRYKVNSGTSLDYWESRGWIKSQDPYGWVQWYCRFYSGRRSPDDRRQIDRWLAFTGPKGRFRNRLINMIRDRHSRITTAAINDYTISPKIRQGLQHWAYRISASDFSDKK